MIQVTDTIAIEENELVFEFTQSPGPGGQHVNRAATAVQLRFDVRTSPSLPPEVRQRLIQLAGRKLTEEGILIIRARRFRSQERNRQDAVDRLVAWIRRAAREPTRRRRTRRPRWAEERRLEAKRQRSEKKARRRSVPPTEE